MKATRTVLRLTVAAVLTAMSLVIPAELASASSGSPTLSAHGCRSYPSQAARFKAINAALRAAMRQGRDPLAALEADAGICISPLTGTPASTSKANGGGVVKPFATSNSGEMTMYKPTYAFDSNTGFNVILANWHWAYSRSNIDGFGCGTGGHGNDGGPDGVAVSFSGPVDFHAWSDYHYGDTHGPWTKTTAEKADDYGVGFTNQDTVYATYKLGAAFSTCDDSMAYGYVWAEFGVPNGCATLHSYARYDHTWNSTSVTSISIGASTTGADIGFGWNINNNHWDATSLPSNYTHMC